MTQTLAMRWSRARKATASYLQCSRTVLPLVLAHAHFGFLALPIRALNSLLVCRVCSGQNSRITVGMLSQG